MARQIATAAVDELRQEHYVLDPALGLYMPSFLGEMQRTNLILHSEAFNNAAWTKRDTTVTPDAAVGPDGLSTADLLTEGSAGNALVEQAATVASGAEVPVSRYLKRGNHDWVCLAFYNGGADQVRAWFNLATGEVGTGNAIGVAVFSRAYIAEELADGWYRCVVVGSIPGFSSYTQFTRSSNGDAVTTRVPGGTRYELGAQTELGAFASTYMKTEASTVSRSADINVFKDFTLPPVEMSVYSRRIELGTILANKRVWDITSAAGAAPRLVLYANAGKYRVLHGNGVGSVLSELATNPSLQQRVEDLVHFHRDGAVQLLASIDGAAEVSGAKSGALAPATSWAAQRIYLNCTGSAEVGRVAFLGGGGKYLHIERGIKTMAEMRELAGWS